MGLLDELKSQAEQQLNANTGGDLSNKTDSEAFYREHVKLRMDAAFNFLKELVNQLNTLKLVTRADYPFKPGGKKVTLQHEEYKVYPDSVPDIRQLTVFFTCGLVNPAMFEIRGHAQVMTHSDLLDRFQFEYEKVEQKDSRQLVTSAKFRLIGPLKIKFVLQYDGSKQIIKLLVTNFSGPGTSQYNLKPEQINEAFLDRLGKYILRKETNLFKEEIADDVKAMLRKKLEEEQRQRENEIREAEELKKAEEAARRENSTTGQLKKAVSHSVAENSEKIKKVMQEQVNDKKEKLKGMFNRLKAQAGFDSTPDQSSVQTPVPPAAVRQVATPPPAANRQAAAATSTPTASTRANPTPPAPKAADPIQTNATQATAARPIPPAEQKKPAAPKVFQASSSNPFLKPEDFEPVPEGGDEQTAMPDEQSTDATANPATAKTPNPFLPPSVGQAKSADKPDASAAKTTNPFLQTKAPPMAEAGQAKPAGESISNAAAATNSSNPFLPPKTPAAPAGSGLSLEPMASESDASSSVGQAKPAGEPNASAATASNPVVSSKTPAAPAGSGLSLEPMAAESDAVSSVGQAKPAGEPNVSAATASNPVVPPRAPSAPETTQAKPVGEPGMNTAAAMEAPNPGTQPEAPAAPAGSGLSPEPIASDSESLSSVVTEPESEASADDSSLSLEDELERDLARLMEDEQQPVESETSDDPLSASAEPDFDLSSPDALEIEFEDTDETSEQDNSEPEK